jgi:hypothetical protein
MTLPRGPFGDLIDRHSRFLLDPRHLRLVRSPPRGHRLESRLPTIAEGSFASTGSLISLFPDLSRQERCGLRIHSQAISLLSLDEETLSQLARLTTHSFWRTSCLTWPESVLLATALQHDLILVSADAVRFAEFGVRTILPNALDAENLGELLPGQTRLIHQRGLACCGFEAWHLPDHRVAVRFTEYPGNKGRSVTNCIEDLTTAATALLGRDAGELLVAEHYVRYGTSPSETHDEVSFTWNGERLYGPEWKRRDERWWHEVRERGRPVSLPKVMAVEESAAIRGATAHAR